MSPRAVEPFYSTAHLPRPPASQLINDAKASIHRPSRPFTPAPNNHHEKRPHTPTFQRAHEPKPPKSINAYRYYFEFF